MTSWVITISRDHPQHWDYARDHGFWDMPKHFPVRSGDLVYFRFGGGGGLIGQTEATSDARPLTPSDSVPWDDGRDPYSTRFTFVLLSDQPLRAHRWADLATRLTKTPTLQAPRSWSDPRDEAVFASCFDTSRRRLSHAELVAVSLLDEVGAETEDHTEELTDDEKKVVLAYQVMRQGQQSFRDNLYSAYGACAITGTTVKAALDAAHIRPYSGPKSNALTNGLPLRGDVHRLFDRHMLTVTVTAHGHYTVQVDPELAGTPYGALDGVELAALPTEAHLRPSPARLAEHNQQCARLDR